MKIIEKLDSLLERQAREAAALEEAKRMAKQQENEEALRILIDAATERVTELLETSDGWRIDRLPNCQDQVRLLIDGCTPMYCFLFGNYVCVRQSAGATWAGSLSLTLDSIAHARKCYLGSEAAKAEAREKAEHDKKMRALRERFQAEVYVPWEKRRDEILDAIRKECGQERRAFVIEYGVSESPDAIVVLSYNERSSSLPGYPGPVVEATLTDGTPTTLFGVRRIAPTTCKPPARYSFSSDDDHNVRVWFDMVEQAKHILDDMGGFPPEPHFATWLEDKEVTE